MEKKGENGGPKTVNPNLSDFRLMPEERQRKIAVAGGKASGEARRLKKTFKDIAKGALDLQTPPDVAAMLAKTFPELSGQEMTNRLALLYSQLDKALKGDTRAFEVIRDTAGEKPSDKLEVRNLKDSPFEIRVIE